MEQIKLKDCPPGHFLYKNTLCFRSEYGENIGETVRHDAYICESGEYFWGEAQTIEERENLMVTPVDTIEMPQTEFAAMRGAANGYKLENKHLKVELDENKPETNLDYIRSFSPTDLAPLLIQIRAEEDIDYDWDEKLCSRGIVEYYETSDGDSFSIYEEALEREIWWLNQNYKENTK